MGILCGSPERSVRELSKFAHSTQRFTSLDAHNPYTCIWPSKKSFGPLAYSPARGLFGSDSISACFHSICGRDIKTKSKPRCTELSCKRHRLCLSCVGCHFRTFGVIIWWNSMYFYLQTLYCSLSPAARSDATRVAEPCEMPSVR